MSCRVMLESRLSFLLDTRSAISICLISVMSLIVTLIVGFPFCCQQSDALQPGRERGTVTPHKHECAGLFFTGLTHSRNTGPHRSRSSGAMNFLNRALTSPLRSTPRRVAQVRFTSSISASWLRVRDTRWGQSHTGQSAFVPRLFEQRAALSWSSSACVSSSIWCTWSSWMSSSAFCPFKSGERLGERASCSSALSRKERTWMPGCRYSSLQVSSFLQPSGPLLVPFNGFALSLLPLPCGEISSIARRMSCVVPSSPEIRRAFKSMVLCPMPGNHAQSRHFQSSVSFGSTVSSSSRSGNVPLVVPEFIQHLSLCRFGVTPNFL